MRFGPCVGVVVRFTRAFMKPFRSFLAIALNPLITCRTADLVELTQQTLCVLPTQPIAHKSNLVVPRFRFLERHRQFLPARYLSDVNQVSGLICKGCYRSIPTSVLSLKGEQDLHLASRHEMKPERRTSDSTFATPSNEERGIQNDTPSMDGHSLVVGRCRFAAPAFFVDLFDFIPLSDAQNQGKTSEIQQTVRPILHGLRNVF